MDKKEIYPIQFIVNTLKSDLSLLTSLLALIAIFGQVINLLNPWVVGRTVTLISKQAAMSDLRAWIALALITWISGSVLSVLFQYLNIRVTGKLKNKIRSRLLARQLEQNEEFFRSAGNGEIPFHITNCADHSAIVYNIITFDLARIIVLFLGSSILLGLVSPFLVGVLIVWSLMFLYYTWLKSKQTNLLSLSYAEKRGKVSNFLVDVITNISSVYSWSGKQHEISLLDTVLCDEYHAFRKVQVYLSKISLVQMLGKSFFASSLFIIATYRSSQGEIELGKVAMVLQLSLLITQQIENFSVRILQGSQSIGQIKKALELGFPEKKEATNDYLDLDKDRPISLEIKNLSFSHKDGPTIFKDASLSISPGEVVIIKGPSGVGKSTLFSLIKKRLRSYTGEILINQTDIKKFSDSQLNKLVIEVPQTPNLFNRSLQENILYPEKKNISDFSKIEHIVKFDDIVSGKRSFNSSVGERGKLLSGGQRQRVLFARAINTSAAILLIDEGTSGLDHDARFELLKNLKKYFSRSIILIITHDHEADFIADKIFNLKEHRFHLSFIQTTEGQ